jgi:hypothetical protein
MCELLHTSLVVQKMHVVERAGLGAHRLFGNAVHIPDLHIVGEHPEVLADRDERRIGDYYPVPRLPRVQGNRGAHEPTSPGFCMSITPF